MLGLRVDKFTFPCREGMFVMKIVVFGIGELAELACYYFSVDSPYEVVAFTVDQNYIKSDQYNGLPVVPFDDVERRFSPQSHGFFVAVGYTAVNRVRAEKCNLAEAKGYDLVSYVSSYSVTRGASMGGNCFILEGVVLQPFVGIGNGVIIWSNSVISHNSTIKDYCYLSPSVVVSGTVNIGERVFLGANSVVRDKIIIGDGVVVGTGSVVVNDLTKEGVYVGAPAKFKNPIDANLNI